MLNQFSFTKASASPLLATMAEIITFLMLLLSKKKEFQGNNYVDKEFNILLIGINISIYIPKNFEKVCFRKIETKIEQIEAMLLVKKRIIFRQSC